MQGIIFSISIYFGPAYLISLKQSKTNFEIFHKFYFSFGQSSQEYFTEIKDI